MTQKTINVLFIAVLIGLIAAIIVIQGQLEKSAIDEATKKELIELLRDQNEISRETSSLLSENLEANRSVLEHIHSNLEAHKSVVGLQEDIIVGIAEIAKRLDAMNTPVLPNETEKADLDKTKR